MEFLFIGRSEKLNAKAQAKKEFEQKDAKETKSGQSLPKMKSFLK
jgi:hypothetical protein